MKEVVKEFFKFLEKYGEKEEFMQKMSSYFGIENTEEKLADRLVKMEPEEFVCNSFFWAESVEKWAQIDSDWRSLMAKFL